MTTRTPLRILEISASAKQGGSISRQLSADLIAALEQRYNDIVVTRRDLAAGLPFVDEAWVTASFTPEEDRSAEHKKTLVQSDGIVAEVQDADVLVIGAPMYNFAVPAVLKAWIDMIARARLTFRYTENGVEGMLDGKKAYVVVPSGGVRIGSAMDFATPYLRHVLGFIGITDVEFIAARGADRDNGEAMDSARAQIAELVHLTP